MLMRVEYFGSNTRIISHISAIFDKVSSAASVVWRRSVAIAIGRHIARKVRHVQHQRRLISGVIVHALRTQNRVQFAMEI
jgi:hypothetical protein